MTGRTGAVRHVRALERRASRIEITLDTWHHGNPGYFERELAALRWAIPVLCEQFGVEQHYEPDGRELCA